MLSLDDLDKDKLKTPPVLRLGFRLFFLLGSAYAIIAMLVWMGAYQGWWTLSLASITPMSWHAHEMVFGYAMAVISGFLLTAVKNWTGIQTAYGWRLLLLAGFWLLARLAVLIGTPGAFLVALAGDLLFGLLLLFEISWPVIRARKWEQVGILAKVLFLILSNVLFYMGMLGWVEQGVYWGIYSGLFLIIGLIVVMGRRVIPFFIERGIDSKVVLKNPRLIDVVSIPVFLLFYLFEVFTTYLELASVLALLLGLFYLARLYLWHHPDIWKKPLLWSLYVSQVFITLGFMMLGLRLFADVPGFLAIHALAFGGIGLITLAMMARVAWGHSGRDVLNPPRMLGWVFALLLMGALVRVFLPLVMGHYTMLILVAQMFWIAAFGLFLWLYIPVFIKPRVDERFG